MLKKKKRIKTFDGLSGAELLKLDKGQSRDERRV